MFYRLLFLCIGAFQACTIQSSQEQSPLLPLTTVPAWDNARLLQVLQPIDTLISEQQFPTPATPPTQAIKWSKLEAILTKAFADHYSDAPASIIYLVTEIYRYIYPVLIKSHRLPFALCTCHPLSFRTELLLRVVRDLADRFPATKTDTLHCAIIAPGDLLQEYALSNILQQDFNYRKLMLYLIDLEYEDPQFYPQKTKILEQMPGELHGIPFEKIMRSPRKRTLLLKHARDVEDHENEQEELAIKELRASLNTNGFSAEIHHFQHAYGFVEWAQQHKIQPHLLLMVDPFPIDTIILDAIGAHSLAVEAAKSDQQTGSPGIFTTAEQTATNIPGDSEDLNTYPAFNNILLLKESSAKQFQYLMLRHNTVGVPTLWYERALSRTEGPAADLADHVVARIARTKGLSKRQLPWSTIFSAIETVDPAPLKSGELKESAYWKLVQKRDAKLTWSLESDPYIAFDDIAFTVLRTNGIAYQSQNNSYSKPQPTIYPFIVSDEKKRIKTGLPVKALQEILEKEGFNLMTTPPSPKQQRKTGKKVARLKAPQAS